MKQLRHISILIFTMMLLSLTCISCRNNDTADFMSSLKHIVSESEDVTDSVQAVELSQKIAELLGKYAQSKAEVTPEQKDEIANMLTMLIKNVIPHSLQGHANPGRISEFTQGFHDALVTDLEPLGTLGEISSMLLAQIH